MQPEKGKDKLLRSIVSGSALAPLPDPLHIGGVADGEGFYCMEPFKTLYVRKDGSVQPCCFGDKTAPALGSVKHAGAEAIWKGAGFEAVREGIRRNEYPDKYCALCLRERMGPVHHFGGFIVEPFLEWYSSCYTPALETAVEFSTHLSLRTQQPLTSKWSEIFQKPPDRIWRCPVPWRGVRGLL